MAAQKKQHQEQQKHQEQMQTLQANTLIFAIAYANITPNFVYTNTVVFTNTPGLCIIFSVYRIRQSETDLDTRFLRNKCKHSKTRTRN